MLDKVLKLLSSSHSCFHAVRNMKDELLKNGFIQIDENDFPDEIKKGQGYFLTRNLSSIIAFKVPENVSLNDLSFNICATHNDSPTFKLKPQPLIESDNLFLLEVEPYGGAIFSSWLDKCLTIAGRVQILNKTNGTVESRLLHIDEDLLDIPNVAIHLNREINHGYIYNPSTDLRPVFGMKEEGFSFSSYILKKLSLDESEYELLSHDLFLTNREKPHLLGKEKEFLTSMRLDDLSSAYCSLLSFIEASKDLKENVIPLFVSFDNEEVGSLTRQGAHSTFLKDCLENILFCLKANEKDRRNILADSFLLSVDNAHSRHPNHPELSAKTSDVKLGCGIVIKYNANQSYTSDSLSSAVIKMLCMKNSLPYQEYTNRSDMRGGSTLGNISNSEVSLLSCDIGIPQLAMHSNYELLSVKDVQYMFKLLFFYYQSKVEREEDYFRLKDCTLHHD